MQPSLLVVSSANFAKRRFTIGDGHSVRKRTSADRVIGDFPPNFAFGEFYGDFTGMA